MSRARLIRPGFFGDEKVGDLTRDARLFFAGLWTECDDDGYFDWKPRQLAFALLRFDDDRQAVTDSALAELVSTAQVEALACGKHGLVPSLPEHRIQGGNLSFAIRKAHESECLSGQVHTPTDPPRGATPPPVRTRTDRPAKPPRQEAVRTDPDESLSESVSESGSARREKKNVLEEGVEVQHGAGAPASVAEVDSHLSRPVVDRRPNASTLAVETPAVAVSPPPRLAALIPAWRTPPGPCKSYVAHQSKHRLVEGQAVCDACQAELEAAAAETLAATAKPNGADHAQARLEL